MCRSNHHSNQKGMSLIELSLVLVVIGILLGSGLTLLNLVQNKSKVEAARKEQTLLLAELQSWMTRHKQFVCPDYDQDGEEDCQELFKRNGELGQIPWISMLKSASEMNIELSQERVAGILYGVQPDLIGFIDPDAPPSNNVIEHSQNFANLSAIEASTGNEFSRKKAFCHVIAESFKKDNHPLKIKYDLGSSDCSAGLSPLFVLLTPLDNLDANPIENGNLDGSNSVDGKCLENAMAKPNSQYDDLVDYSEYITFLGGYCLS